jgi:hypothetical protein
MATKLLLTACGLFAAVTATATRAATELPAITVTGETTPSGDIVSKDRDQRSPDIHWPTALSLKWSEVFAHNEIEINAPCATVWNHLVQAQLWPQWCSFSGKVKIKDGSQILQKNTRFSWSGPDLPQDNAAAFQYPPEPLDSEVIEYVPESRIGWCSDGASLDRRKTWQHEFKYSALPITAGFAEIPGPFATFAGFCRTRWRTVAAASDCGSY